MAPALPSVIFDYRGQIVENCEFLCDKEDYISVVTVKDPEARHKAIAVRTSDDERGAFLASDPCDSVQEAIESLHAKSEEAAHLYIQINGYAQPPSLKKDTFDEDDGDADTVSVFSGKSYNSSVRPPPSVSESSESEVLTPASSSKEKSTADKPAVRPNAGRKAPPRRGPRIIPINSSYDDSDDDDSITSYRRYSPRPDELVGGHPQIPYNAFIHPPPSSAPAGYWGNSPLPPPRPVASAARTSVPGISSMTSGPGPSVVPPSGPQPPPPAPSAPIGRPPVYPGPPRPLRSQPTIIQARDLPPPTTRFFPVRLTIKWLHHGQAQILESCRPSLTSLQNTARTYVRDHPDSFVNVTPRDSSPFVLYNNLRVEVKRAFFGDGEAYTMSAATEDLTRWFTVVGRNDIPRFEVEVEYRQPPPPPPPAPVTIVRPGSGPPMSERVWVDSAGGGAGGPGAPGIIRKRPSKADNSPPDRFVLLPPNWPAASEDATVKEVKVKSSKRPGSTNSSTDAVYGPPAASKVYQHYPGVMDGYQDHVVQT